jgi:hypothetical protein
VIPTSDQTVAQQVQERMRTNPFGDWGNPDARREQIGRGAGLGRYLTLRAVGSHLPDSDLDGRAQ